MRFLPAVLVAAFLSPFRVRLSPRVSVVFASEREAARNEIWLAHAMSPDPAT